VTDRYVLVLPGDLAPGNYRLEVILYRFPSLAPVGQGRFGDFALPLQAPFTARPYPRVFTPPALETPLEVDFAGEVRLIGYELEEDESDLRLTLWWQALQVPRADYTVFVHFFDPVTEEVPVQSDAQPRGGTYPTSWWLESEVVSDTVTLSMRGIPSGTYRLAVGLYDLTVTRLEATGSDGERIPNDRVILPPDVER
jgi:hypothetical protein